MRKHCRSDIVALALVCFLLSIQNLHAEKLFTIVGIPNTTTEYTTAHGCPPHASVALASILSKHQLPSHALDTLPSMDHLADSLLHNSSIQRKIVGDSLREHKKVAFFLLKNPEDRDDMDKPDDTQDNSFLDQVIGVTLSFRGEDYESISVIYSVRPGLGIVWHHQDPLAMELWRHAGQYIFLGDLRDFIAIPAGHHLLNGYPLHGLPEQ